eukprot:gene17955-12869_t
MTFYLPNDFKVENIKHWPASATLLAMNETYNRGYYYTLHNAALPFGEIYQRPYLYSIVPYLHKSWTRDWLLNGTGLIGVKALTLLATSENGVKTFDITTIADIISPFPLASNHLHLRLKPGNRWTSADDIQVRLLSLDTGAGPVDPSDIVWGTNNYDPPQIYRQPLSVSVFPDPPVSMRSRLMKERVVPTSWSEPRLLYASTAGSRSADSATLTIRGDALLPPPTTSAVKSNPFPDGYYQMLFKGQQHWSIDSYPMQRLVLACTGATGSSSDAIVYQLQEGVDYITDREQSNANKRVLTLLPGASWCPPSLYVASIPTNVENATPRFTTRNEPQLLRLLAVESPYRGYFIAVNPANFVAGAAMAMVVWPPTIYPKRVSQYPRLAIIGRSRGGSSSNAVDVTRKDHNRRTFWISGRNFPVTKKGTPAPNDGPQHQTTSPSSITSNFPSMLNSIFSPHVNVSWASPPPPTTTFQVRFNRPLMPDRDYTVTVVSSSRARISFTSLFLETSHQQSDLWIGPLYVTHIKVGLVSKTDDDDSLFVDGEEGDAPLFAESLLNEEERAQSRERLCGGVVPANDGDDRLEDNDPNDAYEACLAYMEEMGFGTDSDRELDGDDGWITLANGGVYVAELMYSTEGDE